MKVSVCIPTLNARPLWAEFSSALKSQVLEDVDVLIIDSESDDCTAQLAAEDGFRVVVIAREEFRHGATRQLAVDLTPDSDILVFMTQDVILADCQTLNRLLEAFRDPYIGAAYGRQLPRRCAGPIEAHARLFNYPGVSRVFSMDSVPKVGMKAVFLSNSFAAYRRTALSEIGGFPVDADFGEDTITAARLLRSGWCTAYVSSAEVYHSHAFTIGEEFRRYVSIGRLHRSQPWITREFGTASGEGLRFVKSELATLSRSAPHLIPAALVRSCCKFLGYRIGRLRSCL